VKYQPDQIRQGSIYWLQNCEPLEDDNTKDRPVIVVDDPASLKMDGPVIVIACSTQNRASESGTIRLPDRSSIPQAKSGLKRPTWAVPRWHFPVERERLSEYKGYLTGNVLKAVLAAYLEQLQIGLPNKPH
jgi:mRNA-degrading endonuclease toxin of MazEF toxin-antitoxin module